jgi:DNA-binding transcriptional LysR family regulator
MELRHLRYFVAVARAQNFTRAAESLHIAQPPLTRQIQDFEAELGLTLIRRGTRPLQLTEAGRVLFEQAVQILERTEELRVTADRLRQAQAHRFSIGFVGSALYGELPALIRQFRAARPEVEISLLEMTTLEQLTALKEGRIDAGFGRILFEDPAIQRYLLSNERLVAALPCGHPILACPGPAALADLARETLIIYPKAPRPSYADQVLSVFRDRALKPAAVHEVRELQTALGLVAAETGICLVPVSVTRLRRDNVEYRALDDPTVTSPNIMSCRKNDTSPDLTRILALSRPQPERANGNDHKEIR